jgi:hypothetical protein
MPVGKVAVLRSSLEALLQGLEPADVPPPFVGDRWKGYSGANGAVFHAAAVDGGALVVPFGFFDTADDVALAVRGVLGAALDRHEDARGLFLAEEEIAAESSYDAAVGGAGAFAAVPAADDPRLTKKSAGWSFAAAASTFASSDAKKKVEEHTDADPLAAAQTTLDTKLAARDERGALRRTLSAALNHEVDHSPLAKAAEGEGQAEDEEASVLDKAAEHLRRAVAANPDKITELEGVLRTAVDKEIVREEKIDEGKLPPKAEGDAPDGAKPEGEVAAKD